MTASNGGRDKLGKAKEQMDQWTTEAGVEAEVNEDNVQAQGECNPGSSKDDEHMSQTMEE